jgi:hypothetical protein
MPETMLSAVGFAQLLNAANQLKRRLPDLLISFVTCGRVIIVVGNFVLAPELDSGATLYWCDIL